MLVDISARGNFFDIAIFSTCEWLREPSSPHVIYQPQVFGDGAGHFLLGGGGNLRDD